MRLSIRQIKEEQYYGIRGTRLYNIQDCAMAAMNIMLAAHDMGLGSCFVSAFDEEAISRIFGQQENIRPQGVITLGYTDEKPETPLRYRVESLIGVENYGTAMNPEGVKGGGRVVSDTAIGTYRYGEGLVKYTQQGVEDVGKVTAVGRKKLFDSLLEIFKKKKKDK